MGKCRRELVGISLQEVTTQDFRKLAVWHKAYQLGLDVYRATDGYPPAERYGLTSQLRRSALSVATNIAEGSGRRTRADFRQFLHVALGSAKEVECQLLFSGDLGYISIDEIDHLMRASRAVQGMLVNLIGRTNPPRPTR